MTLISHRCRFIYLKTHKTAGTSLEAALEPLCQPEGAEVGPHFRDMSETEAGIIGARGGRWEHRPWRSHMSARRVRRQIGREVWRSYFKFAAVRNPFDRMVSMFWWKLDEARREHLKSAPFEEARRAFLIWLDGTEPSKNVNKLAIGPFYALDHVVFYERLEADYEALMRHFGAKPAPLPRYKTGARRPEPWRDYYTPRARRVIERRHGFELAFFGYDFSGGPAPGSAGDRLRRLSTRAPFHLPSAFSTPQTLDPRSPSA